MESENVFQALENEIEQSVKSNEKLDLAVNTFKKANGAGDPVRKKLRKRLNRVPLVDFCNILKA